MSCSSEGSPTPTIRWFRRDEANLVPLPNSMFGVDGDALSVDSVTLEDAGEFVCEANNIGGTAQRTTTLQVTGN